MEWSQSKPVRMSFGHSRTSLLLCKSFALAGRHASDTLRSTSSNSSSCTRRTFKYASRTRRRLPSITRVSLRGITPQSGLKIFLGSCRENFERKLSSHN
jgi:hypothetical protein